MALVALTFDRDQPVVAVRLELVQLVGDLVVGALLSQVAYWYSPSTSGRTKLRVQRHGQYWIAKTREEWMAETGLTLKQYKRAIGVLKDKGLVEVRVMRFGGLAISHVRLDTVRLRAFLDEGPPGRDHRDHPVGPFRTGLYTETTTETTDSECGNSSQASNSTRDLDPTCHQGEGMKATEILEHLKSREAPQGGRLEARWHRAISRGDRNWQKPLTQLEGGQLRHLKKVLGDAAGDVIDYAVEHWMKFASRAAVESGKPAPASPHVGYLLMHCDVAVQLMQSVAQPSPMLSPQVQGCAPVGPEVASGKETPHSLSADELSAMLAGLKE